MLNHHMSAIITDCNRSPMLSPQLDLPGFWPGTETKREAWLLRTWFGIVPANKLVSMTWLLWALRSFWRFTLHYNFLLFADRAGLWSHTECRPWCRHNAGGPGSRLSYNVKHDTRTCKNRHEHTKETQGHVYSTWQGTSLVYVCIVLGSFTTA